MTPLAVSLAEYADLLSISYAHALKLANAGEIPTIRLGRRMVVPVRFIEEQVAKALDGAA